MTPAAAVAYLVEIIALHPDFTEDDVYAAMCAADIPGPVADRAYKFTQIAWGRVFLDGLGVRFAPDYVCFKGAGSVIESGELAEQPYFLAAMAVGRQHPPPAGLPRLALMSADVRAVNDALKAGSNPADLVAAPSALFMEPATPAGIENARRFLSDRVAPRRRVWWRFW